MKRITATNLRNLVIETVREEQQKTRDTKLKRRAISLLESAMDEKAVAGKMNPDVMNNIKLSNVDVEKAKDIVKTGEGESDVVEVSTGSWSCDTLYPTQSTMNMNKAIHFALGMINGTMYQSGGPGGDLGAFVSVGGKVPYLLDGHHRWLATCMVKPSEKCGGYALNFPPKESVAILNTMTGGLMGHNQGKQGSGDFKSFYKKEKLMSSLKSAESVPGGGISVLEVIEGWTGEEGDAAYDKACDMFIENLESCPGAKDSSVLLSQGREEMPVADDAEHASEVGGAPVSGDATQNVIDTLNTGKMDVNQQEESDEDEESKSLPESVDLRRWNKLAGILKD